MRNVYWKAGTRGAFDTQTRIWALCPSRAHLLISEEELSCGIFPGCCPKSRRFAISSRMQIYWSEIFQSDVRMGTIAVGPLLKKSVTSEKPNNRAPNWRIHMKNFVRKTRTHFCEPGSVTFSAGWLGQGHTVRQIYFLWSKLIWFKTDWWIPLAAIVKPPDAGLFRLL